MLADTKNIMKLRKFSIWCLFLSILVGLFGVFLKTGFMVIVGVCFLITFFVVSYVYWKCPHCNKRLPMMFDSTKEICDTYCCPHCYEIF